jgi:tetratricopeptide (TPR) repeat protein
MGLFRRIFGGATEGGSTPVKPQRLDYLNEALALERQGDFDAAIVSYRLALRDHPNDPRILQNLAIAFSRTGKLDDAIRHYRRALELDRSLAGAHYGLGFLLMRRGEAEGAAKHFQAFLENPPKGPDGQRWVEHATAALREMELKPPQAAAGMEGA